MHLLFIYNENTLFSMLCHFIEIRKQTSKKETIQIQIIFFVLNLQLEPAQILIEWLYNRVSFL